MRSIEFWILYKKCVVFPAGTAGQNIKIQVGKFLSFLCCCMGVGLVLAMFAWGGSQDFIDYRINTGRGVLYRFPDVIACPAPTKGGNQEFSVWYNHRLLRLMNLTEELADELAKVKSQLCEPNQVCKSINKKCEDTKFEGFCQFLDKYLDLDEAEAGNYTFNQTIMARDGIYESQKALVQGLLKNNSKAWDLEMLWLMIIHGKYAGMHERYRDYFKFNSNGDQNIGTECFLYKNGLDHKAREQCMKSQRSAWINKQYCNVIVGNELNLTMSQIGLNANYSHSWHYWVGNMETMLVDERAFLTNMNDGRGNKVLTTRLSGVGYFRITKIIDGSKSKCVEQTLVRGIKPVCSLEVEKSARWYFDISYENRPLDTIWLFASSLTTVQRKSSFTQYTQFQFAAGLISCCIGLSLIQLVDLVVSKIHKKCCQGMKAKQISRATAVVILAILSVVLTIWDLRVYLSGRYQTVFIEKDVSLPLPVVDVCNNYWSTFGFINTTKFYEYNVSVELYSFLRVAGWQMDPRMQVIYKEYTENETNFREVVPWTIRNYRNGLVTSKMNCDDPIQSIGCHNIEYPLTGSKISRDHDNLRINYTTHLDVFRKITEEASVLAQQLGLGSEPSIAELIRPFFLDPKTLIKTCKIGNQVVADCHEYAHYAYDMSRHDICLAVKLPQQLKEWRESEKTGMSNAVQVICNSDVYMEHSDVVSYYGPGVPERLTFKEDTVCKFVNASVSLGTEWKKEGCYSGGSWRLRASHPRWRRKFVDILHNKNGLAAPATHVMSLQLIMDDKLPFHFDSKKKSEDTKMKKCHQDSELICSSPWSQLTNVYKAVQYEAWCGCSYCFPQNPFSSDFKMMVKKVTGKEVRCCTVAQFADCYSSYLANATWDAEKNNYNFSDGYSNVVLGMAFRPLLSYNPTIENVANLPDPNGTLQALSQITRDCYNRAPCNERFFAEVNYQHTKNENAEISVAFFYESDKSAGTEEVDRLDVAQLVGVLLCGYSMTFGIGVVAVFELCHIAYRKLTGQINEKIGDALYYHLTKSVAVWVPQAANEVVPVATQQVAQKQSVRRLNDNDGQQAIAQNSNSLELPGQLRTHNPDSEGSEQNNTTPTMYPPTGEAEGVEEVGGDMSLVNGTFMAASLVAAFAVMCLLILLFFNTIRSEEYSADVMSSPIVPPPSIMLCVKTTAYFKKMQEVLKRSTCSKYETEHECEALFQTYLITTDLQHCLMWDNSNVMLRLLQREDLKLETEMDMPEVTVAVQGFNGTSLERISPYLKWKPNRNMLILYITRLKQTEGNCESEAKQADCSVCPKEMPETMLPPYLCCFKSRQKEPFVIAGSACFTNQYGLSMAFTTPDKAGAGEGRRKSLTVMPAHTNVMVSYRKRKFDVSQLISVVGGFLGSFLELTLLGILSIPLFFGLKLVGK